MTVAVAIVSAVFLAACGASTTPPMSGDNTPSAEETTARPVASSTTARPVASSAVDETAQTEGDGCSLISDEEASAVLGIPITRNEASAETSGVEGAGCIKGNDRQAVEDLADVAIVTFSWLRGPGEEISAFFDDAMSSLPDAESLIGMGDRALFSPSLGWLIAVRGDTVFTVQVQKFGEPGTQEEVVGLAQLLMERTPT